MTNTSLTHEKEHLEIMAVELYKKIGIDIKPDDVTLENVVWNPISMKNKSKGTNDSYIITYQIKQFENASTVSYMVCDSNKNMMYYTDYDGVELGGDYPYENARAYFKKKEKTDKHNLIIEGVLKGYQQKPVR